MIISVIKMQICLQNILITIQLKSVIEYSNRYEF